MAQKKLSQRASWILSVARMEGNGTWEAGKGLPAIDNSDKTTEQWLDLLAEDGYVQKQGRKYKVTPKGYGRE